MKEDKREMQETIKNAQANEVGGILMKIVGAKEAAERMKRTKFRNDRRIFRNEHDFLSLEAIFNLLV